MVLSALVLSLFSDAPTTTVQVSDGQSFPIEGQAYRILCIVQDGRPEADADGYQWWQDGTAVQGESSDTLTLTLDHVTHDGRYTCAASNDVGIGLESSEGVELQIFCKSIFSYNIIYWASNCVTLMSL